MNRETLGKLLYLLYAEQIGITVQRHKSSTTADHEGPMPWEKLPAHMRARWERVGFGCVREVEKIRAEQFAEALRKKGATIENERADGIRASLLEQEKRRQKTERKNET